MKFATHTAAPELERYPKSERFQVFRSTHRRLMREDHDYRRTVRRIRWRTMWPPILFTPLWLVLTFLIFPTLYRAPGSGVKVTLCIAAFFALMAAHLFASWRSSLASSRLYALQNEKIGSALRNKAS